MPLKTIHGDLIKLTEQGKFDVLIHGCNCFHTMGAGIAKGISQKFPEALAADKLTLRGSREKLGTYSAALIQRGARSFTIVNAYTQFDWRGRGPKVDYEALRDCFKKIAVEFSGKSIGYPMIGAGLAGGNWDEISAIIDEELTGLDHRLVIFSG